MGAGIGKMISPQSIAIGLAAVGMPGKESLILQGVIKYCVLFTVIGGLVCYLMPMLF
jgi:lactate permease